MNLQRIFISAVVTLLISGGEVFAADSLSLSFDENTVRDTELGRIVELQNVVITQSGKKAYADFDGKGAMVIASDPSLIFRSGDTFWFSGLVNLQSHGKSMALITKAGNYRIALQPDGKFLFTYYSNGGWRSVVSNVPLELNSWQQVACYFDSSRGVIALFIDGKVVAIADSQLPFQSVGNDPLYIGGLLVPDSGDYRGIIGGIASVFIAHSAPYTLPDQMELDTKAFEVEPTY